MSRNQQFTEHLRATGREAPFNERRQWFESRGKSIGDSWLMAAREFGLDTFDIAAKAAELSDPPKVKRGEAPPSDYAADVRWVYDNFSNKKLREAQAPSHGAWELLQWARLNKDKFFIQLANKHLATKDDATASKARREQSGKIRDVLERLAKAGYTLPPAIAEDVGAL